MTGPARPPALDLALVARVRDLVADELSERRRKRAADSADESVEAAWAEQRSWQELGEVARARMERMEPPLPAAVEQAVVERVVADLFGLGGFEPLVADPDIEDIFVNGADRVFVSRMGGRVEPVAPVAESDDALIELVNRWASRLGRTERRFDMANPRVNLKLPGGFRLHAIMEVTDRPTVTVRCPRHREVRLAELAGDLGTIDERLRHVLAAAVRARCNIIVSGGTGSGKTTFLRALLFEVPSNERIVTIEDTSELGLSSFPDRHPNVVEMETREANLEGVGAISMVDLTREVLRMSPDRVVVGEVRGAEALSMLKAMGQGNDGSMCTIHADSAFGVAGRLRIYVAEGTAGLPVTAVDALTASAVDLVVHLKTVEGRRRVVSSVVELEKTLDNRLEYSEMFVEGKGGLARLALPPSQRLLDRLVAAGLDPAAVRPERR